MMIILLTMNIMVIAYGHIQQQNWHSCILGISTRSLEWVDKWMSLFGDTLQLLVLWACIKKTKHTNS